MEDSTLPTKIEGHTLKYKLKDDPIMSIDSDTTEQDSPKKTFQLTNASTRYITALILIPIVIAVTAIGGLTWAIGIGLVAVIGSAEFFVMAHGRESQGSLLIGLPIIASFIVGFYLEEPLIWIIGLGVGSLLTVAWTYINPPRDLRLAFVQLLTTLSGVVYLGLPLAFAIAIRNIEDDGLAWILVIYASTWGTDSFAYFGGRLFGKTPLAPKISPKKTREGAVAGVIGGFIPAFIFVAIQLEVTVGVIIVLAIAPFVAIIGDLFESGIKRYFGVKDSHLEGFNVLPGHGGVLDRVDALLWVFALYAIFLLINGIL